MPSALGGCANEQLIIMGILYMHVLPGPTVSNIRCGAPGLGNTLGPEGSEVLSPADGVKEGRRMNAYNKRVKHCGLHS